MISAWMGAFAIGLSLGLLGAGGSILTVPVLVYLVGQPEKIAIAGSLAIVGGISLAGSVPYALKKQIDWRSAFFFGVPGMAGTYGGAQLSTYFSGAMQLALFAVVMILAAYKMIAPSSNAPEEPHAPKAFWKIGLDGLIVGIITGLVGVGGGFLIVPALVFLGGLPMRLAVGTSLLIIAAKSFSGFYKYSRLLSESHFNLDWNIIALFTAIGVAGSFLGSALSVQIPQQKLRKGFGYFLVLMAVYVLATTLPKLI